ncbi:MAG: type 4b pilus protein PilO2 [Bdellovibrionales bacterium]
MVDYEDQVAGLATSPVVTAGGTITLGRRKYAVGLYWQPSPSGRVSQAAREAARQPGQMADFFAVRPGNQAGRVPQFGLGQKEFGHSAGLPTGAASLAEEQPGSWGGVFKVPEGWWLVISRDDLIAPDGDILYADEQQAKQRLQDEIALGGLQRLYVPDTWGIANSDAMPLSLLMQGRADARLQNVHLPIRTYMIAAGAVLFLFIVGYLMFLWQQSQEQESLQRMTAEQQALAELQRGTQLAPPPPPPPPKREWEDSPLNEVWLDACRNALSQTPASLSGWVRAEITCQGATLTVNWRRTKGPAEIPPHSTIAKDNMSAVSTIQLINVPPRGPEELWPSGELNKRILNNNWPIVIVDLPEEPPPTVAPGQPQPPPKPWLKKKITLKSQTAPWFTWQSYVAIPGLVINSLTWTSGWTVEGFLYELR